MIRLTLLALLLISPCFAGTRVWKVREYADTDLFRVPYRISGMTVTFQTTGPADVLTLGHLNLRHRCFYGVTAVGYGVYVRYRFATTEAGLATAPLADLAISSGNIRDCAHHYADAGLESYQRVTPGWYRYEVWAGSHSSDAPYTDGLLEVNPEGGTVNQFIVRVEDVQ